MLLAGEVEKLLARLFRSGLMNLPLPVNRVVVEEGLKGVEWEVQLVQTCEPVMMKSQTGRVQ